LHKFISRSKTVAQYFQILIAVIITVMAMVSFIAQVLYLKMSIKFHYLL